MTVLEGGKSGELNAREVGEGGGSVEGTKPLGEGGFEGSDGLKKTDEFKMMADCPRRSMLKR